MGTKGDRAAKEPLARDRYADGWSLIDISKSLDVSETTLRRWKSESKTPGEGLDLWDKRRKQKRNYLQRARDLLDDQYEYMEGLLPEDRDSKVWDSLSKAFAIVERSEKREKEIRRKAIEEVAQVVGQTAREQGESEEDIKFWQEKVLGIK